MSVTTRNTQRSMVLRRTAAMLTELTDDELSAMESVAKAFLMNRAADSPFRPLTEHQLLDRIDRSLAQAKRGESQSAEDAEAELTAEFGL